MIWHDWYSHDSPVLQKCLHQACRNLSAIFFSKLMSAAKTSREERIIHTLAQLIIQLTPHRTDGRWVRALIGISGGAGAGKSTLAEAVSAQLSGTLPGGCAIVQMDGFHIPNAKLATMTVPPHWGSESPHVPAASVKGAPHTMDAEALLAALQSLLQPHHTTRTCPVYDRSLHDPRPHGTTVSPSCRAVLVEGLYLLLGGGTPLARGGAWAGVYSACQQHWSLWIQQRTSFLRICERKVSHGGRALPDVIAHWKRSEQPTWRLLSRVSLRAKIIICSEANMPWAMVSAPLTRWSTLSSSSTDTPTRLCRGQQCHLAAACGKQAHSALNQAVVHITSLEQQQVQLDVCSCLLVAWCNRSSSAGVGGEFCDAAEQVQFDAAPLDAVHCAWSIISHCSHVCCVRVRLPSQTHPQPPNGNVARVTVRRLSSRHAIVHMASEETSTATGYCYELFY